MSFKLSPFLSLANELKSDGVPSDVKSNAVAENMWFTEANIDFAVASICDNMLQTKLLNGWIANYENHRLRYNNVAVIMAGNIPLVGFFDLLTCAITGCQTYIKPSSKDSALMVYIYERLKQNGLDNIHIFDETINYESVIATGSNNANRYFAHRFTGVPSVMRKDRHSVAIIDGSETNAELNSLWSDVFMYYGLGCRNVSTLLVPYGYDFSRIKNIWRDRPLNSASFINGVKQRRAVKAMCNERFIDGDYYLLSYTDSGVSVLGDINIIEYRDNFELKNFLSHNRDNLQCVVGHDYIDFGMAQQPKLDDWADGVNIFEFLMKKQNY